GAELHFFRDLGDVAPREIVEVRLRVVADAVAARDRGAECARGFGSGEIVTDGEERERELRGRGEIAESRNGDVVDRGGRSFRRVRRETVNGPVVGDLVEIDVDGTELRRHRQARGG